MKPAAGMRWCWLLGAVLVLGFLLAAFWMERRPPPVPPITIHFDGLHTIANPSYPYGFFTIINSSSKVINWEGTVEAPLDPDFEFHQALSSFRGGGPIPPGSQIQFQMLVAGKKGVPFRLVAHLYEPPMPLTRLWIRVSDVFPLLKKLWNPQKVRLRPVYGEWCLVGTGSQRPSGRLALASR